MTDWIVCSDFDGTICIPDSSEHLLRLFAPPEWEELDDAVWAGRMTEREAFQKQISLLRVTWPEARAALREGVKIRDGFKNFVEWCRQRELPFVILSSGLRSLINELLNRAGVSNVTVESHDVVIEENRWRLVLHGGPRLAEHCSHCKCAFILNQRAVGKRIIYIGDGFTDLCPAPHTDVLFAADRLAEACRTQGLPFHPFSTFRDIEQTLESIFPTIRNPHHE
jgi:2,3-diketo-5-methylthio-1-phosphopentane phosphatase